MLSTTIKSFTANLDSMLNEVENNSEPLLLKRKSGNVMILTERDYAGLIETLHLLSTHANSNHLKKALKTLTLAIILKYNLSGYWSRRITSEHRIVYKVEADEIIVASCKFHY